MSLTKAELVDSICENFSMSRVDAKDLVECFFEEICAALERGEEIKLSGFGNFALKDKNARPGRNPKTGEEVTVSPRRVVTFKPGQKVKQIISSIDANPEYIEQSE